MRFSKRGDAEDEADARAAADSRPESTVSEKEWWAAFTAERASADAYRVGDFNRRRQWAEWQAYLADRAASWDRGRRVYNANSMSFGGEYRGSSYTSESNRRDVRDQAWLIDGTKRLT